MKSLIAAFLIAFSTLSFASVEPESFTGSFTVGDCSMSPAKKAEITLNGTILIIKFEGDKGPALSLSLVDYSDEFMKMHFSAESFTLTNEFFAKLNEGMYLPVLRTRIGRSATGDRVRLNVLTYDTNMESECVLYRH